MSAKFIRVIDGAYRNFDVSGKVFQLVREYKSFNGNPGGGFVIAKNNGLFVGDYPEDIRIKVPNESAFEFISEADYVATGAAVVAVPESFSRVEHVEVEVVDTRTDEELMDDIRESFKILDDMTRAVCCGDVRALIVSGPPGVGKSFGVEKIIEPYCLFDDVKGTPLRAEVVKGSASPIGLYKTLYNYRDRSSVLVFDDCDTILFDDVSLNLLKGALDSGSKRKISWLSESRTLKDEGIPNSFEFNGGVIFITNLKFDKVKSGKLKDHLDALQSRCHYLDLTLDSARDKLLRIKQVARDCDLFADMALDETAQDEVIQFMADNQNNMREMSLRMAIKIAQLRRGFVFNWQEMAKRTCMQRG